MNFKNIFPAKDQVLTNDYAQFENFFPIATVELNESGKIVHVPIIYTFFQGGNADDSYFLEGEYGGNFSLDLIDLQCRPTFQVGALKIDEDYQVFLREAMEKYKSAVKRYKYGPFEFTLEPEWLQADDTPEDEQGNHLKYVCQVDLADIVGDDCRMYVFYDPMKRRIRNIYQRD